MNNKKLKWLPVLVWAGVIFYLSSLPIIQGPAIKPLDFVLKKTAHVTEYAVLFFLLNRALKPNKNHYQTAFLIGLFYAFTDEIHQIFTPGRGASLRDVLVFDAFGLILSWLLHRRFKK
jgi:VanZ family protein